MLLAGQSIYLNALDRTSLLPAQNFGYVFDENAAITNFISPIDSKWGELININKKGKEERWVFDNDSEITIVYLSFKTSLPSRQKVLQVNNIWRVHKKNSQQKKKKKE